MAKLKLDLHEIFNKGKEIDRALEDILVDAMDRRIEEVEIIPGKGSGQLKKKVLRFLDQPHIKSKIHRTVKTARTLARLFVYFKY
ncbi:MAG: Smr/MutS family protein [Saprospiraceae bacterium]|nr:Smr/MutS family protein [Saprospiraceae bacterium]